MTFKLRYDKEENVLRSIGEPPNGILGVAHRDDAVVFYIDPQWEPTQKHDGMQGVIRVEGGEAALSFDGSQLHDVVLIEDAAAACEDERTMMGLWLTAISSFQAVVRVNGLSPDGLPVLRSFVEFLEEVRDALHTESQWRDAEGR